MANGRNVELQPMTTVAGAASAGGRTQDIPNWGRTDGARTGALQIQLWKAENMTLVVEGSDDLGGSFTTLAELTQSLTGATLYFLKRSDPIGSEKRLPRFVRWRIDASSSEWITTFRINMTLK